MLAALLAACSSTPPPPDWQVNAHGSLERAVAAHLSGDARVATLEFDRARADIARTGRIDLMARAELVRCAAQLASLVDEPCVGFEALRADAPPAEQAYADFLRGRLSADRIELLPPQHRPVARPSAGVAADLALLQGMADPLSRLVASAVWLRDGRATLTIVDASIDNASAQGWRRPLLAWLGVQQKLAEVAGDRERADRAALVLGGDKK
nr:hypothetical protein [Ideonella sp. A 288]